MTEGLSAPFSLFVAGFSATSFRVHRLRGREALSKCYSFDVLASVEAAVDTSLVLGARASLVISVDNRPRVVHGVVSAVRAEGSREGGARMDERYRLVPAMALLEHTRRSRVFQDMTVPAVIEEVLSPHIDLRWALTRNFPSKPMITQYQESDLEFVERLAAEAGVFHFFQQPAAVLAWLRDPNDAGLESVVRAREVIVFADNAAAYPSAADSNGTSGGGASVPTLHYREGSTGVGGDRNIVECFRASRRVRAARAVYREYDPERPLFPSSASAAVSRDESALPGAPELDLELYEHGGAFLDPEWDDVKDEPARLLARARRRASTATATTSSGALSPGYRFELVDHPRDADNGEYVVVTARYKGSDALEDRRLECRFECAPASTLTLPERGPRRVVSATLTATVVGPVLDELHADALGRIKIHFNWDRAPGGDRSSCWVRTMQPWAGAHWGMQFIPRAGMEVVVAFEDGDPDKPIVLGCVFNGTHTMPFDVGVGARSGLRSRSTRGTGANELSFEDQQGKEQLYLHASRDLKLVAEHDHETRVENALRLEVRGESVRHVVGVESARLEGGQSLKIDSDQDVAVTGARRIVAGTSLEVVRTTRALEVAGAEQLTIAGPAAHTFKQTLHETVAGHHTQVIGTADKSAASALHVEGTRTSFATERLELRSDREIVLGVGSSFVRITKDRIDLVASAVSLSGEEARVETSSDGLKLCASDAVALVAKSLTVKTDEASVAMSKDVKIDGKQILLNSPSRAKDELKSPPDPTRIELTDQDGRPLAGEPFLLKLDDRTELAGALRQDGSIELSLEEGGTVVFPRLGSAKRG
ncbi:MAG: type VI secretion system tip protein TssI/VgrG [Polyangiaceae bacterium]